jgi:hypothetical protein
MAPKETLVGGGEKRKVEGEKEVEGDKAAANVQEAASSSNASGHDDMDIEKAAKPDLPPAVKAPPPFTTSLPLTPEYFTLLLQQQEKQQEEGSPGWHC